MRVLAGTSGYSYKEWKGAFYPDDVKPDGMLAYYATQLPTVEINNTFYRMPSEKMIAAWAEQVPDDFSFVLKVSRRITHQAQLKDCDDMLAYLLKNAMQLGDRLGPMLFQFPPWFKKNVERLETFLALLPDGLRAAFEFRSSSWRDDEVYDVLRARNIAWVTAEDDPKPPKKAKKKSSKKSEQSSDASTPPPAAEIVATADYGYLRLRRSDYDDDALAKWAKKIGKQEGWRDAFVFFKHEDEAAGPRMAKRFLELTS